MIIVEQDDSKRLSYEVLDKYEDRVRIDADGFCFYCNTDELANVEVLTEIIQYATNLPLQQANEEAKRLSAMYSVTSEKIKKERASIDTLHTDDKFLSAVLLAFDQGREEERYKITELIKALRDELHTKGGSEKEIEICNRLQRAVWISKI